MRDLAILLIQALVILTLAVLAIGGRSLVVPASAPTRLDILRAIIKRYSFFVTSIFIIAIFVILMITSKSFSECEWQHKDRSFFELLACARVTIGENDGSVVAIATIVLAGFTWALWRSTEKLWDSAEKQRAADELTRENAERPWILLEFEVDNAILKDKQIFFLML